MFDRQAIPTIDERIEKTQTKPKVNLKRKSTQKAPLTFSGYTNYFIKKRETLDAKGETKKTEIKISHASGPILNSQQQIKASFLNPEIQYDQDIVENWIPHMAYSVVDESSGQPLSAAEADSRREEKKNWIPHYFVNPLQDLDYLVIEAISRMTFVGPLFDALLRFIVGTGFRPELELINPDKDEDVNEKLIDEHQEVIDTLLEIDNQISKDDSRDLDTSFTEKITAMISVTNLFNRGSLMFGYEEPIKVNGTTYKEIPSSLKFAHPRDLGIIEADPGTWRLRSVQWRNAYYMVPAKDMIYLWNPLISAKTRNSWLYGDSMLMPMLDASRTIRKNIGVNFPAMGEASWSGLFILAIKPQGQTLSDKEKEYDQVVKNFVRGAPNILMEDPEDVKSFSTDFQPKIKEFADLTEMLLRYCVASTGLPHSMFYDESTSNRSTMIGKIQMATATVINPMRQWIGREISNQWYNRWFRLIYKDKKDLMETFRIKMVFDDLRVEEWFDKIEAVNDLDSRKQLTDVSYGEMAGIDNYQNKVEADAEVTPGGEGKSEFKFGDDQGNQFEIKKRKEFAGKTKKKA